MLEKELGLDFGPLTPAATHRTRDIRIEGHDYGRRGATDTEEHGPETGAVYPRQHNQLKSLERVDAREYVGTSLHALPPDDMSGGFMLPGATTCISYNHDHKDVTHPSHLHTSSPLPLHCSVPGGAGDHTPSSCSPKLAVAWPSDSPHSPREQKTSPVMLEHRRRMKQEAVSKEWYYIYM